MIYPVFLFYFLIQTTSALFEGDTCILEITGEEGKCINLEKCESARQLLASKKLPQHCGFQGHSPIVCCPQLPKSVRKCREYFDRSRQVYAVYVGEPAELNEFPHMAALGYGNKTNPIWLCGGTIISERYILTAAHCVSSRDFGPVQLVRLGALHLRNDSVNDGAEPKDFNINRVILHPGYQPPSHYNDIALLELDRNIYFGISFKPACLHVESTLPNIKPFVTGWGKIDFAGPSSSRLLKAELEYIEPNLCAQRYVSVAKRKLSQGIQNQSQICAGHSLGKDTCPGDSGGPLQFYQEQIDFVVGHFTIVGITSFGKGCGFTNSAGVYTRVSNYVPWIEDIVWPDGK